MSEVPQPGSRDPVLQRARAGDAAAFAELFAEHEDAVRRVCRRMLGGDEASANDAASEVFLRARRALDSHDGMRPFRPWLLRIAGNYCIDQIRRRQTESRIFEPSELDPEALLSPGPSPLGHALLQERRDELREAIDALPQRDRLILMLRYFAELDYAQIAELCGTSRAQVGSLLFRAKRRLRERLEAGER